MVNSHYDSHNSHYHHLWHEHIIAMIISHNETWMWWVAIDCRAPTLTCYAWWAADRSPHVMILWLSHRRNPQNRRGTEWDPWPCGESLCWRRYGWQQDVCKTTNVGMRASGEQHFDEWKWGCPKNVDHTVDDPMLQCQTFVPMNNSGRTCTYFALLPLVVDGREA